MGDSTSFMIWWHISSGKIIREYAGAKREINSIAITQDNKIAVTGDGDRWVRVWELSSGI